MRGMAVEVMVASRAAMKRDSWVWGVLGRGLVGEGVGEWEETYVEGDEDRY